MSLCKIGIHDWECDWKHTGSSANSCGCWYVERKICLSCGKRYDYNKIGKERGEKISKKIAARQKRAREFRKSS